MYTKLRLLFFFAICAIAISHLQASEKVVKGVYNGRDLFVENKDISAGVKCISEVYVNGKKQAVPNTAAFIVDLSGHKLNEPLVVKLVHDPNCTPKVINPNALIPKQDFNYIDAKLEGEKITWASTGEDKQGKYKVEVKDNGQWIIVEEFQAKDVKFKKTTHGVEVVHHSGVNEYRLIYEKNTGKQYFSDILKHENARKNTFSPSKVSDFITFEYKTRYLLLDKYGNHIKRGVGKKVDCRNLKKGKYWINFDHTSTKFEKK